MSAQAAGKAASAIGKAAGKQVNEHVLNKGAKRDPELYVSLPNSYSFNHLKMYFELSRGICHFL